MWGQCILEDLVERLAMGCPGKFAFHFQLRFARHVLGLLRVGQKPVYPGGTRLGLVANLSVSMSWHAQGGKGVGR